MIRMAKRGFGKNVEILLIGETKQEVVEWRNFFFNWGGIQIAAGTRAEMDLTGTLDDQENEIEELGGEFHFSFFARKDKIVQSFRSFLECKAEWPGGKRPRAQFFAQLEKQALERFEGIPTMANV